MGTLHPDTNAPILTVTDNLFAQGTITNNEISIYFEPTTSASISNGELTFGGTDPSKFTGSIAFSNIPTTYPYSFFWSVNQSIKYGNSTILSTTAGIVDTGTAQLLLCSDAFSNYQADTGAVLDTANGMLRITTEQFGSLKSLFFTVGSETFEFIPNAQIWPRSTDGDKNHVYLVINNLGTPCGQGVDFINGFSFLQRLYSVFDTTNKRVGFATTPLTYATTN